jgi:hypothetical protein
MWSAAVLKPAFPCGARWPDAAVVLLRPDGRVAWADQSGKVADGLRTALTAWFGPGEPDQPATRC